MIPRKALFSSNQSVMLLGPRLTGKSSLIKNMLSKNNIWAVDLLQLRVRNKYSKEPELFREDAIFQIKSKNIEAIYVDEIQKMPELLDELHSLFEEYKIKVILTGSSPRKLKRGGANLLGGRVPIKYLMPFISSELLEHFNLEQGLLFGLLPGIYFNDAGLMKSQLMTYVDVYLKEEILSEGIVRNLEPFSRFLEVAALYSSQTLNLSNISRECAVPLKTVQSYFEVLEDTLIAYKLPAWDRVLKKQLAITPKFYFFDNGVVNTLLGRLDAKLDPIQKGFLFEQFVINEIRALINYKQSMKKIFYWKTKSDVEVDLIIASHNKIEVAIEIKYKNNLANKDFVGLNSMAEDHKNIKSYVLYLGESVRKTHQNGHKIFNYLEFLNSEIESLI